MSSIRKKIVVPGEIVGRPVGCWLLTKIALFGLFLPIQKTYFFTFSSNSPVSSRNSYKWKNVLDVSINPIFCTSNLPNRWKKHTLNGLYGRMDQKKQRPFLFVWWHYRTEWNQTSPVCSSMSTFFLSKRFSKSVHPFQRYCLKTAIPTHRPTL